jgi:hypothetical protein
LNSPLLRKAGRMVWLTLRRDFDAGILSYGCNKNQRFVPTGL